MKKTEKRTLGLVTTENVKEEFGVCRQTILNWEKMDILQRVKIGRKVFFRHADLEHLINSQIDPSLNNTTTRGQKEGVYV